VVNYSTAPSFASGESHPALSKAGKFLIWLFVKNLRKGFPSSIEEGCHGASRGGVVLVFINIPLVRYDFILPSFE
jgi:hypothetical protein